MHIKRTFDSMTALLAAANGRTDLKHPFRASRKVSDQKTEWSGTTSYSHARTLATSGDPETREAVETLRDQITPYVLSSVFVPETVYDVTGEVWDMGRVCEGIPECAMTTRETEQTETKRQGKIVRIVVGLGMSGGIDRFFVLQRGAAICAVVDAIEMVGRRVELIGRTNNSPDGNGSGRYSVDVVLKAASEPLQVDQLAFALANASMLRRIMFSLRETELKDVRDYFGFHTKGGYGVTEAVEADGDINLQPISRRDYWTFHSPEASIAWALATLRSQGVAITDGCQQ